MSIYYIENENGTFLSPDGKRRFIRLRGKAACRYLSSPEGKQKRFFKTTTEESGGESVYIEIPPDKVTDARRIERRAQYVMDCIRDSGFSTISIYEFFGSDGLTHEDVLSDPDTNVEEIADKHFDIEYLHKALSNLTSEEFALINLLYLTKEPLSEEKIGQMLGLTQQGVSRRKISILKKLKKLL